MYLFLHPTDETTIDAQYLFEYMKQRQKNEKVQFDWVFLNCSKVIYVCNYKADTLESIVLPENAENFLNTEAEYLRYLKEWVDGAALDEAENKIE